MPEKIETVFVAVGLELTIDYRVSKMSQGGFFRNSPLVCC